jgi:hypothetical protein
MGEIVIFWSIEVTMEKAYVPPGAEYLPLLLRWEVHHRLLVRQRQVQLVLEYFGNINVLPWYLKIFSCYSENINKVSGHGKEVSKSELPWKIIF